MPPWAITVHHSRSFFSLLQEDVDNFGCSETKMNGFTDAAIVLEENHSAGCELESMPENSFVTESVA